MPAFFLLPTTGRTNFRTFPSHYSRHTSCNRRSFTKVRCKNVFKHKSGKHSANIDAKRIETSVSIHTSNAEVPRFSTVCKHVLLIVWVCKNQVTTSERDLPGTPVTAPPRYRSPHLCPQLIITLIEFYRIVELRPLTAAAQISYMHIHRGYVV